MKPDGKELFQRLLKGQLDLSFVKIWSVDVGASLSKGEVYSNLDQEERDLQLEALILALCSINKTTQCHSLFMVSQKYCPPMRTAQAISIQQKF